MKKFITLVLALSAASVPSALSAQETATFQRMAKMIDPEQTSDSYTFTYDDMNRLVEVMYVGDSGLRYEYKYNDKGQCVEELWNQNYNWAGKYYQVSRTDYTFDEAGRLATVAIYNIDDILNPMPKMVLMGIYYYTYNEAGQLTDKDFYIGETKDAPYTLDHFEYNDRGLLATETISSMSFSGSVSSITRKNYTYDAEGRIQQIFQEESESDSKVQTLVPRSYTVYEYDERGNLFERYQTRAVNDPSNKYKRSLYMVNEDVPASQVIYPVIKDADPYYEHEHYGMLVDQLIGMDEYSTDNDGDLYLMHSWEYDYDEVQVASIDAVGVGVPGSVIALRGADVVGNELRLHGVESVDNLVISDMNGRIVKTEVAVGSSVDVSDLATGAYLVVTNRGAAKFVR